ncbi:MAG TPA: hypothetical protein VFO89_07300 [Thermoanaerobaculia bacterium]|nr:hypothetical protein [Thermoanaerobaculia bacterium]
MPDFFVRHPVVARLTALTTGYMPRTPPACTASGVQYASGVHRVR